MLPSKVSSSTSSVIPCSNLTSIRPSHTELRVDVDVTLGDDVEVDAYGLVANLTGDIGVSMRSPDPVNLSGSITVVDGIYKQYGQNLQASGDILFVGPVAATRLELQAVREIETENRIARGTGDDTELVVSGRLNDKLLVKYGRSVFDTESTLYLRYDLTKKLYVEAAEGVEQAVDLFYEFSF